MNSFGRFFMVSIFGESHGDSVGVLVDGCPAGIPLIEEDFNEDLARRKGGKPGTTGRVEPDRPLLISGVFKDRTSGAPILIQFKNAAAASEDYKQVDEVPRPGHADFVAARKFGGFNDFRGGGHFSGRLTVGLVAAGVIAKKVIRPTVVSARVVEAGGETNIEEAVSGAIREGDSIGGIIECTVTDVPVGLGEPFFGSVESLISHIIFSIPGIKAIEFGSGFAAAKMTGSEHNDVIIDTDGTTETNNAGGINGGITNGNDIYFRVAVKPTPTISKPQRSINMKTGEKTSISIGGRHDTCFALRLPVVVESAVAFVMADLMLQDHAVSRVQR
jgi:chorismate synthase